LPGMLRLTLGLLIATILAFLLLGVAGFFLLFAFAQFALAFMVSSPTRNDSVTSLLGWATEEQRYGAPADVKARRWRVYQALAVGFVSLGASVFLMIFWNVWPLISLI
jgi:hypothetical protein